MPGCLLRALARKMMRRSILSNLLASSMNHESTAKSSIELVIKLACGAKRSSHSQKGSHMLRKNLPFVFLASRMPKFKR